MISNIEEIRARKGPVIVLANKEDEEIKDFSDDLIRIPKTKECLSPILTVIPMQLFAYYVTVFKNLDPDQPRNLSKVVTVE